VTAKSICSDAKLWRWILLVCSNQIYMHYNLWTKLMFKIQHTKSTHSPTKNFNSATHSNQFNFKSNAKMH